MIANIAGVDLGLWIIIALVVLVGGSQLPKIARNVGLAGREFRKAQREAEEESAREKAAAAQGVAGAQGGAGQGVAPPPPQPLAAAPAPAPPVAAPAPPVAAPVAAPAPSPGAPVAASSSTSAEGSITLTPGELDALLKAREQQVRNETSAPSDN